jgi:hypothetical protein
VFRIKIVEKNEAHIFCRTHFPRKVLLFSSQLNKRDVMNTFSNIQIQQATMVSTIQSGLRKNKQERLRTELKPDLICSLIVVLYYNATSQHILNNLYICQSAHYGFQNTIVVKKKQRRSLLTADCVNRFVLLM